MIAPMTLSPRSMGAEISELKPKSRANRTDDTGVLGLPIIGAQVNDMLRRYSAPGYATVVERQGISLGHSLEARLAVERADMNYPVSQNGHQGGARTEQPQQIAHDRVEYGLASVVELLIAESISPVAF